MKQEATLLASNAAAFIKELGMLPTDVTVVCHFSEAFLLRFIHQHLKAHTENVNLVYHVRLSLERVASAHVGRLRSGHDHWHRL